DAKDWYERTIHGKNWELRNLLDNTAQANLGAVQGQNAGQLGAQALNRANGQNGNVIIPAHTVFDEDWSFADGRPTDRLPNAPNTNTGNTVVVPGIRLGQVLYWFRTNYPTVTAEKQRVLFGSTVQGSDPVGRFYSNLRRLARLAGIDVQQIRLQFIRGLSPANQIEVRRLGLEKSVDELLPKLEEIERYTAEQLSGAYLRPISDPTSTNKIRNKDNVSDNTGMTETDIKNLVKSMISSSEQDESSQIHERKLLRPSQMEPGKIYRGPGLRLNDQEWLRMDEATDRLSALAGPSYLQTFMDKISKGIMDRITPLLPQKKKNTSNDGMDEITNGMAELSINNAIAKGIEAGVNAVIKSSKHRCSNCNRTGHNSRKCTRKKRSKSRSKKRGSVNKVAVDSGSDTNSSDNDSSDNNSDSGDSSSEVESDHSFDSGSKKRQSLESPIQRSSQKIQKKSGTIIDSQIRKIILAMFNDPENTDTSISDQIPTFTKSVENNKISNQYTSIVQEKSNEETSEKLVDLDTLKKCVNCENKSNREKELEKALLTSVQSVFEMIEFNNDLHKRYESREQLI
ncbi:2070_t:CDS:2, partial [Entrophospora sp. SA101]